MRYTAFLISLVSGAACARRTSAVLSAFCVASQQLVPVCLPRQYGLLDVLRAASRPRRVHGGSERMDMNGGEMFFETASTLITFVLLGR